MNSEERRQQSLKARELVAMRRNNPQHKKMIGVLGIDSIIPKEESNMIEQNKSNGQHAFGLDHILFTSETEFQERKEAFQNKLKSVDAFVKMKTKNLEAKKAMLKKEGIHYESAYRKPNERTIGTDRDKDGKLPDTA